jgi:tRNA pseudouridine32 synthase/23S rRNA pseudouridine746 synthase
MWEDRILFLDGEAIVLDKPAGLAVHPGPSTPESLERFLHHFRFGFERKPLPVHRLDRDTSGCLLLSRNPKAHRRFHRAFEEGRVEKSYVAVVAGVPDRTEGVVELALAKISSASEGWRMVPDPSGKAAVTHWRLVTVVEGRAMILFKPETGRTHQIRVHAAEGLGLPIIGDPVYGVSGVPMLLHARSLRLERPGKNPVAAEAPLPLHFHEAGFDDECL